MLNYIIPIWNWSDPTNRRLLINLFNYIIPIWNWSPLKIFLILLYFLITLFLYGIGASARSSAVHFILRLHYSYMELEPFQILPLRMSLLITLFLYGIGA